MAGPRPRCFRGFRDVFADELLLKQRMIDRVRAVYERYGFLPLETPAVEFVDVLGKFLPESAASEWGGGGIFAFPNPELSPKADEDDPDRWLALRYDLTASLARVVARYQEIPRPFRRYQVGSVWRLEKPGPGRYREFTQFDFDTVGVASVAADAEACCIVCEVLEALGFGPRDYVVRVNDRKVLQGVLEKCGLDDVNIGGEGTQASTVLRAIDKLDRLGRRGVIELLGEGRTDKTGDFTQGARLAPAQIEVIEGYLDAKLDTRGAVCDRLAELVGDSSIGAEGVAELRDIDRYLEDLGLGDDQVVFDPTIVRGLAYYTGPVFEGILTREITDEKGKARQFGSVYGGGRYDTLVERFTGQRVPATGASVGVDRLLEAMKLLQPQRGQATAEVLVVTMDAERMSDYLVLARRLREAGVATEVYLGKGGLGKQLKYADRVGHRLAVIAGADEFAENVFQVKDLALGRELSDQVESRDEWRKGQPAQVTVAANDLVARVGEMLGTLDQVP